MKTQKNLRAALLLILLCIFINPTNIFSQDFWEETYNFGQNTGVIDFEQDASGVIYASYSSKIAMRYSDDDGVTWTDISSTLPYSSLFDDCYYSAFCKGNILFTHIHSGSFGSTNHIAYGIYRSYDKGTTWVEVNNGLGADTNITNMYLLPNGNILAYYQKYNDGKLYLSTDDGDSWTLSYNLNDEKDVIWVAPSGDVYLAYSSNLLYKSTDNGVSWVLENDTYNGLAGHIMATTSTGLLIVPSGTGFAKSSDNGLTWTTCTSTGLTDYVSDMCITQGDTLYVNIGSYGNPYSFVYSTDLAESWDSLSSSGINEIDNQVNAFIVTKNGYLLASVYFDGVYRSAQPVSAPSSEIKDNKSIDFVVNIYPNPTYDKITIKGENIQKVEIIDINGRIVTINNYNNVKEALVTTDALTNGVYSLKITTNSGVYIEKQIINK